MIADDTVKSFELDSLDDVPADEKTEGKKNPPVGNARQKVFMNGMLILSVLLMVYIPAQLIGYHIIQGTGFIREPVFVFSIFVNLGLLSILLVNQAIYYAKKKSADGRLNVYALMVVSIAALYANCLIHVHLVGSQNSLHHILTIAALLVVSWFLRWREVLIFMVLGNLGLILIVALEVKGVLPYAPLFVNNHSLASIFLDWRSIAGQSFNYVLVLVPSTAIIWKLRKVMEWSEKTRRQANEALVAEVEQRKKSEEEKAKLITELQNTLNDVKTLQGLLPICMKCKNIRNDQGYWQRLENYFHDHTSIEFTHGLCPDCAKRMIQDEDY